MKNFLETNIIKISDQVEDQFPEFYKEYGEGFIDFLTAYYEWLESQGNPVYNQRNLYTQYDIDRASEEFLIHYKQKYMLGLPNDLLGNQRLLQKHILELYGSKGSQQSIRLLFRLLFNEDIEFYIPSYDIFKLSDNTWLQSFYIEVTDSKYFDKMIGKIVTGKESGARALVENYDKRFINDMTAHVIFISDVQGVFIPGEVLLTDGISEFDSSKIIGSVTGIMVVGSSFGMKVGDTLTSLNSEKPIKAVITEIYNGNGSLKFTIEKAGTYYSLGATFRIERGNHIDKLLPVVDQGIGDAAYAFPKKPDSNIWTVIGNSLYYDDENIIPDNIDITGYGAEIKVIGIKDTHYFQWNNDKITDFYDVPLSGTYPFAKNPNATANTIIEDALTYISIEVGSIEQIQILNPGLNYSSNVYFYPIDPYTSNSGILDANGNPVGMNGLILGEPATGDSLVSKLAVRASGYNNLKNKAVVLTADRESDLSVSGNIIVGGVGNDEGYYDSTKSFLSDDKYLFDGHYYQDFSYVIKASMTLDKYIDILKKISHPAGNVVYGNISIIKNDPVLDIHLIAFNLKTEAL